MVRTHVLDSGTTVLIDEMRDVRSFALGVFVRAGSGDEPPSRQGMSHFLEHLLFKRTRRRTNAEIARVIDRLGGEVDAFTTKEYTGFYVHTLDAHFDEALDLVGDVVLAPAFNAADIETERGVILEEIGEANDNPDDLVHEIFVRSFWETHPLGAPILGTARTVGAITRSDLYAYYGSRYAPRNLIVSLAGRVEAGRALDAIEQVFSRRAARGSGRRAAEVGDGAPAGARARPAAAAQGARPGRTSASASRRPPRRAGGATPRPSSTSRSAAACPRGSSRRCARSGASPTRSAPRSTPIASEATRRSPPPARPRNLPRLIDVTLRELRKLKRGGVSNRELGRAKENLKSGLILSLESTVSRMSSAARQQFYLGRVEPPEELLAKVEAVTRDEVDGEADRLFDGRALSLAVVGNVARLPVSPQDLAELLC